MGARVVHTGINELRKRIEQQDKEISKLHAQLEKGCSKKTRDLETQVKKLQDLGDEIQAMLKSHHQIMQQHEKTIVAVRKK